MRQAARQGAQVHQPACGARRLGDADGAHADRGAERLGAGAGRCGRGRGAQAKGVAAPAAGDARRRGAGHRRVAAVAASARPSCWAMPRRSTRRPAQLLALAHWIAEQTGASVGYLGEAANSVGAQLVGALPGPGGLNAGQMLGAADEGAAAAERRAGARRRRRRRPRARRCSGCRPGGGADAVQGRGGRQRRRAAADRAVHRNRRHASSMPKAACRASTAWSSRWARRARPGRCCACWATCWACRASSTTAPRRCAPRRWATRPTLAARLDNRAGAALRAGAAVARPGARGRRADLRHRCAGAPRRVAAAHAPMRSAPVVGLPSALWQQLGLQAGDKVRVSAGRGSADVAGARRPHAGRRRRARAGRPCRARRRWARCSAPSASRRPETRMLDTVNQFGSVAARAHAWAGASGA